MFYHGKLNSNLNGIRKQAFGMTYQDIRSDLGTILVRDNLVPFPHEEFTDVND